MENAAAILNTGAYPIFSSVSTTDENTYLFRRPAQPTKILLLFSLAIEADENICIFVGCRRKCVHFRRFYSIGLFLSAGRRIYIFSTVSGRRK
jgi:hypothetical protein